MSDPSNKSTTKIRTLIVTILNLLVMAALLVFTLYYSLSTNTLENNNRWYSIKVTLNKKVMGAFATMETPITLAGNHLNLGVWHGNQELFVKDVIPYQNLSFKVNLEEKSHFSFFYNLRGDTLHGIRISANPKFPSMSFSVFKGQFLTKEPIDYLGKKNQWVNIHFKKTEGEFILNIDDKKIAALSNKSFPELNIFGLRGSERGAFIDDITLRSATQEILFEENFRNKLFSPLIIALIIFSLILLNVLLYVFRHQYKWLVAIILFGVLFSIGYYLYYQFYQQYRYATPKKTIKILPQKEQSPNIEDQFKEKKKKGDIRVLFIGSSQTWGAGATSEQNTFVRLFEDTLNFYPKERNFICINVSVEGQTTSEMLDYYRYLQPIIQPDFVVLNLGFNDNYEDVPFANFKKNIQTFIDYSKGVETPLTLIPEPSNPEHPDEALNARVATTRHLMDSIGRANRMPIIYMQPFIEEHFDDGFLFWDVVHLSDFGHKLFAKELYRQMIAYD